VSIGVSSYPDGKVSGPEREMEQREMEVLGWKKRNGRFKL
jgi:hypothetical protein